MDDADMAALFYRIKITPEVSKNPELEKYIKDYNKIEGPWGLLLLLILAGFVSCFGVLFLGDLVRSTISSFRPTANMCPYWGIMPIEESQKIPENKRFLCQVSTPRG